MNTPGSKPTAGALILGAQAEFDPLAPMPGKDPGDIQVLELVADEEINVGCDPYNSTGQHVITEFRTDKDDEQ